MLGFASLLLLSAAVASPLAPPRNRLEPRQSFADNSTNTTTPTTTPVSIKLPATNNTITGNYYASYGIDQYLGIPYAQPPLGSLRLSAPVAYNMTNQNISARTPTPACLQDPLGSLASIYGVSEDCLTVNVYTPHGSNLSTSPGLPVYAWIYGGGFQAGASNTYNGIPIVAQSVAMFSPVVFVSLNYRLGIWGWCQGVECETNNATNLGLADQLLALQWIQKNIAAFGGDPNKVTVAGQSAGAISIALHMINPALLPPSGNSTGNSTSSQLKLFRGAIMESGTASTYPLVAANLSRQSVFNQIAALTGCTANVSANSTLSGGSNVSAVYNQSLFNCVKNANNNTLYNATITLLRLPQYQYANIPFGPSVDGRAVPASPASLVNAGKFLKIPFISGNNKDEGTIFTPPTINSTTQVTSFASQALPIPPNVTVLNTLESFYPDPASGSPFGTGNNTFGLSPSFKQAAAIFGDVSFQAPRRNYLAQAKAYNLTTTYSYLFNTTQTPGTAYGVAHGDEVYYVFGSPALAVNATNATIAFTHQVVAYWVNFVNALNPNGNASSPYTPLVTATLGLATWPSYTDVTGTNLGLNMLQLQASNVSVIQDNYRQSAMFYINSVPDALDH